MVLRNAMGNLTPDALQFEKEVDEIVSNLILKGRQKGFSFEEIFYEISTCMDMQVLRLRREERRGETNDTGTNA